MPARTATVTYTEPTLNSDERIANGAFDTAITDWDDKSTAGGSIAWSAGTLALTSDGVGTAATQQTVSIAREDVAHTLAFTVAGGTLSVRVGTTDGGSELYGPANHAAGAHSVSITPTEPTIYPRWSHATAATITVDTISMVSALSDLKETVIFAVVTDCTGVEVARVPASKPTGGGTVSRRVKIRPVPGESTVADVKFFVRAVDLADNMGPASTILTVTADERDEILPGAPAATSVLPATTPTTPVPVPEREEPAPETPPSTALPDYWVDATRPDDTGNGLTEATAKKLIQSAVTLATAGQLIRVKAGTYNELVSFPNAGTSTSPITIEADPFATVGTVIISGTVATFQPNNWVGGDAATNLTSTPKWITIRGFAFSNTESSKAVSVVNAQGKRSTGSSSSWAIRAATGWKITDCTFNDCKNGINCHGDDIQILDCTFDQSGKDHFHVYGGARVLVKNVTLSRANEDDLHSQFWEAGTKIESTEGFIAEDIHSFGNHAVGFWLDISNKNARITRLISHDNVGTAGTGAGSGVWIEICDGPVVLEDSCFYDNAGHGIGVFESTGVTVRNCTSAFNGSHGLRLRNLFRSSTKLGWRLRGLTATSNRFKANVGATVKCDNNTTFDNWQTFGLVINGNIYDETAGDVLFGWRNAPSLTSLEQVRSTLNFEVAGSIGTVAFTRPFDDLGNPI